MATLQDHHKKNFMEVNKRLGLTPDEHIFKSSHAAFNNDKVVFAADQASGDIIGKTIPVASIAELKRLSGVPNDGKDDHIDYQEITLLKSGLTAKNLKREDLDNDSMQLIQKAASAYILGNSEKVKDYEDLINAAMFPGNAVVFTAENLYVKSGQTVVLGGSGNPEIYNFGTITVEQGGQIQVIGNVQLTCQIFTQL